MWFYLFKIVKDNYYYYRTIILCGYYNLTLIVNIYRKNNYVAITSLWH